MKEPLSWSPFRFWLSVIIPVLAVLITWTAGYLYIAYGSEGFPVSWRGLVFRVVP